MAAPNLANIATSISKTALISISTTSATNIVTNLANSGYVIKVDQITLISSSATWYPQCTIDLYKNGTTAYKFLPTLSVQPNATIEALTKPIYLEEGDSIRVTSTIGAVVEVTCAYSYISDATIPFLVEYLVVAGGGGGGYQQGGGGGAGGYQYSTYIPTVNDVVTLTVGAGGAGATSNTTGTGGSDSVFRISSTGGGKGGSNYSSGGSLALAGNGGSGGGGGVNTLLYGNGTAGQGNNGGASGNTGQGGGGGGAGAVGGLATVTPMVAGNGGIGKSTSIAGTATYFAGGGGGGSWGTGTAGTGGTGGGGNGSASTTGFAGTINTGGGGGGGAQVNSTMYGGGAGGSGVVILAYPVIYPAITTIGAGLVYALDTTSRPGYYVYKFTSGTGTITW